MKDIKCSKCGSTNLLVIDDLEDEFCRIRCLDCNHLWIRERSLHKDE